MSTKVTVRLTNGKELERKFSRRCDADAWADQTQMMGVKVVSIVTSDEARDSEGAPLATCSG